MSDKLIFTAIMFWYLLVLAVAGYDAGAKGNIVLVFLNAIIIGVLAWGTYLLYIH